MNLDDTQLLFADVQPTLVAASRTMSPDGLARAAAALGGVARLLGLPMTFALVPEGGQPGHPIPELEAFATADNSFQRTTPNLFHDGPTAAALAAHGRRTIVLAGFSAEVAVLYAAIGAIDAGYTVHVAVDAIGSRSERTETVAMRQIERAGGVTTSVASLLAAFAPDFARPPGSDILRLMQTMHGT